jgi:hypothetical protein
MQEACDKRLQEVDRYLFPNRKGFFTLRASPGLASVARRALGALDVLHNDPSSTSALRDLALAYLDRGHLGEALSTLRRVADSGQASALDLLQLALVEEQLGRRSAALSHYRATVAQQGDLALAHTRMGVLLATQGEFNQSRVHLEESLRLVPSDREALEALHSVALKQGDSSSAAQAAGRLQELAPAITTGGGFAGRFALIGYTLSDTLAGHGEPVVIEYYLQCSRPAPGGHTLRHRILGTGMGMSHQTVDTADSSSLANALPGETVVVRCELGIQWNPLGGNGQLQLGLASRDGGLLPTTNAVGAWLPVVGLAVSTGQAAEPVAVVQASEMTRETGFMMGDGLSVSPKGAWTEFHPGDGRWRLVAVVRGVPAGGEWPIMSLEVNGQEKLKSPVEGKGWLEQTCSLGPGPIRARVALKLLNDYYNAATGEDRNLVVRELRLVEETHFLAVTPLR